MKNWMESQFCRCMTEGEKVAIVGGGGGIGLENHKRKGERIQHSSRNCRRDKN